MPIEPGPCRWRLPDPLKADPGSNVVGAGADLEPGTLLEAYRSGLFPMHLDGGEIGWWSPDPRGVLPLDGFRVTRSMRQSARRFEVTFDTAFDDVIRACGERPDDERWIKDDIIAQAVTPDQPAKGVELLVEALPHFKGKVRADGSPIITYRLADFIFSQFAYHAWARNK